MEGGRDREQEKQSVSVNTANGDLAKVFTKLATKHCICFAELCVRRPLWGWGGGSGRAVGVQRRGVDCSWPTVVGAKRLLGPSLSFCRRKRQAQRGEEMGPRSQGSSQEEQWGHKWNWESEGRALKFSCALAVAGQIIQPT